MLRPMEDNGRAQTAQTLPQPPDLPDRPAELLAGVGAAAWEAFNAMQATKQRHFDLLEAIDAKQRKYNIDATRRDTQLLAHLLADHDLQVHRFTAAAALLKEQDAEAHTLLFTYIGVINHAPGTAADDARRTH